MLASQEEPRPGEQMRGWPPSLCVPSTQGLSAAEEAGVYQRYTQLCCPSVSAAQGDLALKRRRPGNRSPMPARSSLHTLGSGGRGGVCRKGERSEEGAGRGSLHQPAGGAVI